MESGADSNVPMVVEHGWIEPRGPKRHLELDLVGWVMSCNVLQHPAQHLPSPQQQAIALMVAGGRPHEVAAALQVDRSTVWRWQQSPVFAVALSQAKLQNYQETTASIAALADQAISVVAELMRDHEVPPRVRLTAAKDVLDRASHIATAHAASDGDHSSQYDFSVLSDVELETLSQLLRKAERR